jgi:NAD+--asparagine ADP-ribosyltransferase
MGRFIVSLMAFVALAGAAAAQPFTVKNVEIDATAGSAAEAQRQACRGDNCARRIS